MTPFVPAEVAGQVLDSGSQREVNQEKFHF